MPQFRQHSIVLPKGPLAHSNKKIIIYKKPKTSVLHCKIECIKIDVFVMKQNKLDNKFSSKKKRYFLKLLNLMAKIESVCRFKFGHYKICKHHLLVII